MLRVPVVPRVTLLLAAAFVAVGAGVVVGAFTRIDLWAIHHLMPWFTPGSSSPTLSSVTLPFGLDTPVGQILGELWVYPASVPVSALVVIAAGAVLWRRGRRDAALAWAAAWVAVNALEVIGKTFVSRPELHVVADGRSHVVFPHSFPSGHALRGLLVAAVVAHVWSRARIAGAVWIAVTLVLLVVIGFHTPSDVLGGALLSGAVIGLALRYPEPEDARVAARGRHRRQPMRV